MGFTGPENLETRSLSAPSTPLVRLPTAMEPSISIRLSSSPSSQISGTRRRAFDWLEFYKSTRYYWSLATRKLSSQLHLPEMWSHMIKALFVKKREDEKRTVRDCRYGCQDEDGYLGANPCTGVGTERPRKRQARARARPRDGNENQQVRRDGKLVFVTFFLYVLLLSFICKTTMHGHG